MKQSAVGGVFVYRQNPQNKLDVVGLQGEIVLGICAYIKDNNVQ
jgi:hypothetical protein